MKKIIKTFGILSILAVIPGAFAASSRVGMVSRKSPRLPSIAGYIVAANNATTGGSITGTTGIAYLADPDCIDSYTSCITGNDACGSDFEECTNNILLHAKMPVCLSVLSQCSASGRASLFGTSDLNAIATSSTSNTSGEIVAYTYPTASSVLGQYVNKADIENKLSASDCVKRYTNCLKKESVCGGEFELCTDAKEFKKQALACESTLARCQSDGKIELFGSVDAANKLNPATGSRLKESIDEGAALAVNNAVATCNKVTDQCILNACAKNPNKCITDRAEILIRIADAVNGGKAVTTQDLQEISKITTSRDIRNYIAQECKQTIGTNKYCYMTVMGKIATKDSVLSDPDNVEDVFDDMYQGTYGRFAALNDKINQIVDKFDAKVQDQCIDTMSSCAMRSCGGGIGSVCYKQSRDNDGSVNITKSGSKTYKEIKSACRSIVDTDASCQYAAVLNTNSLYSAAFSDESNVFTTLFPEGAATDPIGIVATLNATLATSYNDAAIENMKKQCQTVALSCVKSMCGTDYTNCYRNRTDIVAGTYDTGNGKLDRSMNKMGGILDYNIVIGLCMNTVKNAEICNEHLKVAAADWRDDTMKDNASWTSDNVRGGWLGANTTKVSETHTNDVLIACAISEANANDNCPRYAQTAPVQENSCVGVMDEDGCIYDEPVYQSMSEYVLNNAGTTLFQELLADVEREAQAKYNAKLTKEQNICLANNNGGIQGASDNGSTFMWVKLKGNKVPKNYQMKGLRSKEFTASNDLYGSFCRARITVKSDDRIIQKYLGEDATAYFATGDSFTCGSWISEETLKKMTEEVRDNARKEAGEGTAKEGVAYTWGTIAPALVGGIGGAALVDSWQKNGSLGGLLSGESKSNKSSATTCLDNIDRARNSYNLVANMSNQQAAAAEFQKAVNYANTALRNARSAGASTSVSFTMGRYSEGVAGVAAVEARPAVYDWDSSDRLAVMTAISGFIQKGAQCGNLCKAKIEEVETLLNGEKTSQNATAVINGLVAVRAACNATNSAGTSYGTQCNDVVIPSSLRLVETQAAVAAVAGREAVAGVRIQDTEEYRNFASNLNELENACVDASADKKSNGVLTGLAGGLGGAVIGAGLGAGITASVLNVKYENAANAAEKAWMEDIGNHIQCYVGTEELGSYGDVIGIEID